MAPGFTYEFLPMKTEPKFQPYIGLEDHFQISAATFLNQLGALWFHTPNGGLRDKNIARKFKAMGLKPGVPDILIWDQRRGYKGFAVELKCEYYAKGEATGRKNTTTPEQDKWLSELQKLGWKTLVTWSLDEFIFEIEAYYGIKTMAQSLKT